MDTDIKERKRHDGFNVSIIRKALGLTQDDLAVKTGFQQKYISNLESQSIIPDDTLKKIADVFNVSSDFIKDFDIREAAQNYTQVEKAEQHIAESGLGYQNIGGNISYSFPVETVRKIFADNEKLYERVIAEIEEKGSLKQQIFYLKEQLEAALKG